MKKQRRSSGVRSASSAVRVPRGLMYAALRAVSFLGLRASGTEIRALIARQTDGDLEAAKVYVALSRLEGQGLVSAQDEIERPAGRRGRPRRIYKLTATGLRALQMGAKLYADPVAAHSGVTDATEEGAKA
jgi:DNA-binding PadR family transcriptional regulator